MILIFFIILIIIIIIVIRKDKILNKNVTISGCFFSIISQMF